MASGAGGLRGSEFTEKEWIWLEAAKEESEESDGVNVTKDIGKANQ